MWGVRCDVSEPQQVAALGSFARAQLGTVDRWVNNAASITQKVPLWETQPEELLRVTNTNVAGAFLCCREAVNRMREQPVRCDCCLSPSLLPPKNVEVYPVRYP